MKKNPSYLGLAILLILAKPLSLQAQSKPNLGELSKNNENFRYVAIGSSLSAGVRDGGVYAEAQETAFPALLAKQMGISDFRQALLPGTGTGREFAALDRNGVLDIQKVPGLFDDTQKGAQLPKVVGDVDNLAVPYLKVFDLFEGDENNANGVYDNRPYRHLARLSNDKKSLPYLVENQKFKADFFTYEFGFHDFIQFAQNGGYTRDISFMCEREFTGEKVLLDKVASTVPNGVILNVPNYLNFPIFKMYSLEKALSKLGTENLYIEHWQKSHVRPADEQDILLPQGSVADLFAGDSNGLSAENPLKDEDVLDSEEQRFADVFGYNKLLRIFTDQKRLPYVDLEGLYDKVLNGEYQNADGVSVDSSYPSGNFFSSDGITPTALGQAIIANEIIGVLNEHYKANIPLLNLKNYATL
ncbi:hypothetical protein LAG90_13190 [Marinilongibacter aquaticus]|uniref:hypothetical protein n=1 Tax=Marinilongibacter aquaticus TaxID=2975157 RepID=UPI0021BDAABD|nr:hypothetical protein [Marinilongibacter aquaticus]UBM57767.1 hypothetical protein LAG90_13190 [Marinilongibacter aquaticus]